MPAMEASEGMPLCDGAPSSRLALSFLAKAFSFLDLEWLVRMLSFVRTFV
jgi:hypothetical protein